MNSGILVVILDDLRFDLLNENTSPFLTKLMEENISFPNAFANSDCTFLSISKILLGSNNLNNPFASKLLSYLHSNDFRTYCFTQSPISFYYNFMERELFISLTQNDRFRRTLKFLKPLVDKADYSKRLVKFKNKMFTFFWFFFQDLITDKSRGNEKAILNKAIHTIKECEMKGEKYLVWLHLMTTHPFFHFIPKKVREKFGLERITLNDIKKVIIKSRFKKLSEKEVEIYRRSCLARIAYADNLLKHFFNSLPNKNRFFILLSDHGEEIGEHGRFGHGLGRLYDEVIRIPLLVSYDGLSFKFKKLVDLSLVSKLIIEFVKMGTIEKRMIKGNAIIKLATAKMSLFFNECFKDSFKTIERLINSVGTIGFRTKKWKYIKDKFNQKEELYNLKKDPYEKKNLLEKA